ncbi:DUF2231 domain-containing protein [Rhodanobacter sp. B2A1Ga4]|uniref:DUF2231 domain-containing protein n=1 Tax=Rhodanobacter sp. B2A1Ga4 TaxID=2778647 RepID=UPI001B36BE90|nr:DUF2231 domain-containing protein [Rhodanobacter sp. B2A1Ga4]MBQ4853705.1 DUF2231 domain-containing protein [Rhodanobacter sp. B2A1Ga4]
MRHPLHPALVHFPIACWSLATAADLASLLMGEPAWRFAGIVLLAGIGFSIPAMLAGLLELARLDGDNPAIRDVNRHMLMVMAALCCYVASLFLRLHGTHFVAPGLLAIGLSVLGFLCLGVAGWLGGKLVYGHRLGVSPLPPA